MNAADLPEAKREETRGASMTEYRFTGELPQVLAAVTALFGRYAPAGYGTRVHEIVCEYPSGPYKARMSRLNSCE